MTKTDNALPPSDEPEALFDSNGGSKSKSKSKLEPDQSKGSIQRAKDAHGNIKEQGLGKGLNTSATQGDFGRAAQGASRTAGNIKDQGVGKGLNTSASQGDLGKTAKNISGTAGNIKDQGLAGGLAKSAGEGHLGETAQNATGAAKNIKDQGMAGGLAKSAGEGHLGEKAQGGAKVAEGASKKDAGKVAEGAVQLAGGDETTQVAAKHAARIGKIAVDVAAAETGAGAVEAVKDTAKEIEDVVTHPDEVVQIGARVVKTIAVFVIAFFAVIILILAIFADISGGSQKAADFNSGALCPAQHVPPTNVTRMVYHGDNFDTSDTYSEVAKKYFITAPGLIAAIDFREASNYIENCKETYSGNASRIATCEIANKNLVTCRSEEIAKKIREGATAVKDSISPDFSIDPENTWIKVDDYGTLLAGLGYFQTIDKGLDPKTYKPWTDPWVMNMFAQPHPKDEDGNLIPDSVEDQIIDGYGGNKPNLPIGAATFYKIMAAWISETDGCNVCSFDPFGYQPPEPPPPAIPPTEPGEPIPDIAGCDIKDNIMGATLRSVFCKAGEQYNISASLLAALYARESGKSWEGHTHVNRASFGADINSEYALVGNCIRNSVTATGPCQLIDSSWQGVPNWPTGEIRGDRRYNDNCRSNACLKANRDFNVPHPMTRCRWGDSIYSQAALIMIMFNYNNNWWNMNRACSVNDIRGGKLVGPSWTTACVRAVAHGYYGGTGYEDRVVDPFNDIKN